MIRHTNQINEKITNAVVDLTRAVAVSSNRRLERGASLVEYALLIGLIALVCVAAVGFLGSQTGQPYSDLGSALQR